MADIDAKKIEELRGQETEYLRHKADYEHGNVAGPEAWHAAARVFGNAMIPHAGQLLDLAERASLPLAGEDAGLPCHADQVAEIERRLMRNLGYENSHSHKVAFDQFANELHRMWSEDYRSLSLRVEAEKRAREEAERWKGILHKQVDDFAERYAQAGQDANKLRVDLRSAETHSAALARALEEARDELLECKADYHRNPSSVIDKCNAVLAEARSPLAPRRTQMRDGIPLNSTNQI